MARTVLIVWGYRRWWLRRPASGASGQTRMQAWRELAWPGRILAAVVALALGWSLPVMGVSLLAFLAVDGSRTWRAQPPAALTRRA
ncbi:hypothetical protein G6F53_014207 [Rhizopus delemar]|nr:hypothetical protein G6F53_014207 [Rhizopus delemar]